MLKELSLNLLVVLMMGVPLFILEWMGGVRKHGLLSVIVWLMTLAVAYIWVLPWLGLGPNPAFWANLE